MKLNYFDVSEFDSPDKIGSGKRMDAAFLIMLDNARHFAKIPFHINSGYRTRTHNKKVGGSKTSSHLRGYAVDIACVGKRETAIMIASLTRAGFRRIGLASTFIHVDNDPEKLPGYWGYV